MIDVQGKVWLLYSKSKETSDISVESGKWQLLKTLFNFRQQFGWRRRAFSEPDVQNQVGERKRKKESWIASQRIQKETRYCPMNDSYCLKKMLFSKAEKILSGFSVSSSEDEPLINLAKRRPARSTVKAPKKNKTPTVLREQQVRVEQALVWPLHSMSSLMYDLLQVQQVTGQTISRWRKPQITRNSPNLWK